MAREEDLEPRPLTTRRPEGGVADYWLDGDVVRYGAFEVKGADAGSFRSWPGGFGCDARGVWCTSKRLRGADAESFAMSNRTWARDRSSVWTIGGQLEGVDIDSFEVCDDGVNELPTSKLVPYGYAKDRERVYYYGFQGKPRVVRKAEAATFRSENDGHFASDARFVFCQGSVVTGARVAEWRKVGGFYSSDGARVFYYNRRVRDADAASFVVEPHRLTQLARDATRFWRNDVEVDEATFRAALSR